MDRYYIDHVPKQLAKYIDLLEISVSLQSLREDINDKLGMQPGSTQRVLRNMEKLKNLGFYLKISTVLTKCNATSSIIMQLFQFILNIDADEWTLAFVRPFGEARKNWKSLGILAGDLPTLTFKLLDLSKNTHEPLINFIVNMKNLQKLKSSVHRPSTYNRLRICRDCQGEGFLSIAPSGNVYTCLFLPEQTKVGNIRQMPLSLLWEDARNIFPLNSPKPQSTLKKCLECPFLTLCKGGCRGNAFALSGDITECDKIARNEIEVLFSWFTQETQDSLISSG